MWSLARLRNWIGFVGRSGKKGHHPFFAGLLLAGLPILLYSIVETAFLDLRFVILAALTALASVFPVRLPSLGSQQSSIMVTASDIFVFSGILLISPEGATCLAALDCIIGNVRTKHRFRTLVNLGVTVVSTFLAGSLFYALAKTPPPYGFDAKHDLALLAGFFFSSALLYSLLNSGLTSLAVSLSLGLSWLEVWRKEFFWSSLTNLTGVLAVAAMFLAFPELGFQSLAIAVPMIMLMYYSYRINHSRVDSLKVSQRFLQSTLDSLSTAVAILDNTGKILEVNSTWNNPSESELFGPTLDLGSDYISRCESVTDEWKSSGLLVSKAVQQVIQGQESARFEYSSSDKADPNWFSVSVTRFDTKGGSKIVVAHEDITELRKAEKRIIHLAYYDDLTGLPNRAFLMEHLRYLLGRARRTGERIAILALDLDNFERVNSSLGQRTGDTLLCGVAARLKSLLRQADCIARDITPSENIRMAESMETVIRLGGDEFLLVLTDVGYSDDVTKIAQRIQHALAAPIRLNGQDIFVSTTVGTSIFPEDGDTVESLLQNANSALYHAKQQGRNSISFYSKSINNSSSRRLTIESQLRNALETEAFALHYQPRIEVRSEAAIGAEALLRLPDSTPGSIGPAEFIPVAEEDGLIIPITDWILHTACAQAKEWQAKFGRNFTMAVNLSTTHLKKPQIAKTIESVLQETQLNPANLELEITEGILLDDFDQCVRLLTRLKETGVRIALDDFGTGYSSLSYLSRLPIDILKIDQSFLKELEQGREDRAIVKAVVAVSKSLGLRVVAEGVETREQLDFLRSLGCDEAQGFLFSRPLPRDSFAAYMSGESTSNPFTPTARRSMLA
ncbi:MAG: EAL domain-containing protein [Acidobacteriota bacterium]|nr:MAG: EAL domain-containing protein [Acidobacteriota bacterium]